MRDGDERERDAGKKGKIKGKAGGMGINRRGMDKGVEKKGKGRTCL